ncbi:TA system antitoxin ParD family protein [Nocardioides marmorisolisilvae]|uniref:ParD-like family protein n=1 Tax=Nocardioides marmorisolisilvae TaxID=1542737 RepID=A0A3N0DXS8_9ACTN|nr:hypothetical protein [Nocardioides marmorisolisilvae]RNL80306.1 hypothetical protein EFL95_05240 [Nocardioides marmorisolisilvae]
MATTATTPTRFDSDLFAAAKAAGGRAHRSAAQQLAHWARLGQELEASAGVSQRDIDRVLAGQIQYDEVGTHTQAAVRTAWREQLEDDLAALDLRARFEAEGRTRWSEADATGEVTVEMPAPKKPAKKVASRSPKRAR